MLCNWNSGVVIVTCRLLSFLGPVAIQGNLNKVLLSPGRNGRSTGAGRKAGITLIHRPWRLGAELFHTLCVGSLQGVREESAGLRHRAAIVLRVYSTSRRGSGANALQSRQEWHHGYDRRS